MEEKNPKKASRLLHNAGMKRMSSICRFVRSYLDFFFYRLFGPQLSVMAHELWKDMDLGPGFETPSLLFPAWALSRVLNFPEWYLPSL